MSAARPAADVVPRRADVVPRRADVVPRRAAPRGWSWPPLWASRLTGARLDDGRAIVEFVFLGVLVLVPLIYLVVTVGRIQAAAFAATTAAREAGRAFTTAESDASARARARAASDLSFADFGFDDAKVDVVCDGSPCLRPDGRVTATASVTVTLPLVPAFLDGALPASVPVSSTHVATVDRFARR